MELLKMALGRLWDSFRVWAGWIKVFFIPRLGDLKKAVDKIKEAISVAQGGWEMFVAALKWSLEFLRDELVPFLEDVLTAAFTTFTEKAIGPLIRGFEKLRDILDIVNRAVLFLKGILDEINIPDELSLGSPSPFERSLRGIAAAAADVNSELATMGRMGGLGMQAGALAPVAPLVDSAPVGSTTAVNNARTVNVNISGVNITSGMEEEMFFVRVENAVQRALRIS